MPHPVFFKGIALSFFNVSAHFVKSVGTFNVKQSHFH